MLAHIDYSLLLILNSFIQTLLYPVLSKDNMAQVQDSKFSLCEFDV